MLGGLERFFFDPRPLPFLLLFSALVASAHAAALFSLPFVLGTADYWRFPAGVVGGSINDMASVLVGYLYIIESPWSFPVFHTTYLDAPYGASVVWSDTMPIVALAGKITYAFTGRSVNLLGFYAMACFVLPGPFMTWALAVAGQRSIIAMIAGTAFAMMMPILLWRWGHLASSAQFLIVGALALYLVTVETRNRWQYVMLWSGYLVLALLVNNYLLFMSGAVFAATLAQRWLNRIDDTRFSIFGGFFVVAPTVLTMIATGHFGSGSRQFGSFGFGYFSMNLLSPIFPQKSGILEGFDDVLNTTGGQYEGFAYLGAGLILASILALPLLARWLRDNWKRHVMLLIVLLGACAVALSHRVFAGDVMLVDLPLPGRVVHALGVFRSAGRFIWLPEYALLCAVIVLGLRAAADRRGKRMAAICLVFGLVAIQAVDVGPLRRAVADSTRQPVPPLLDRDRLAALADRASAIRVFPSFSCVTGKGKDPLRRANLELQLVGASAFIPINSFYHARANKDCAKERQTRYGDALEPGVLYVYLDGAGPRAEQLDGGGAAAVCGALDWARYCLIPVAGG